MNLDNTIFFQKRPSKNELILSNELEFLTKCFGEFLKKMSKSTKFREIWNHSIYLNFSKICNAYATSAFWWKMRENMQNMQYK